MSADDTIREAARLMRERAQAAMSGPWEVEDDGINWNVMSDIVARDVTPMGALDGPENAAYIASMHPAVALAVADWLDEAADYWYPGGDLILVIRQALAVARAYLGAADSRSARRAALAAEAEAAGPDVLVRCDCGRVIPCRHCEPTEPIGGDA